MQLTKTEKTIGIALAIALLLLTLSGSGYFFFNLKTNIVQWIAYNACSPSSLVYLVGFIVFLYNKNAIGLALAFLPMYYLALWDSSLLRGVALISLPKCRILL